MKRLWVILFALLMVTCEDLLDKESPKVDFQCPPGGGNVGRMLEGPIVTFKANVSDNNKVEKIELWYKSHQDIEFIKDIHYHGDSDTKSPWSIDFNVIEAGFKTPFSDVYDFTIVAYDKAGNRSDPEETFEETPCRVNFRTNSPQLNVKWIYNYDSEQAEITWDYKDTGFGFQKYVVTGDPRWVDKSKATITDINTQSFIIDNFREKLIESEVLQLNIRGGYAQLQFGVSIFDSNGKGHISYVKPKFYVPGSSAWPKAFVYDKNSDQFKIVWNKTNYDVEIFEINNFQYYQDRISNFDKTSLKKITDRNDTTFVYSNFGGLNKRKYLFIDYISYWGLRYSHQFNTNGYKYNDIKLLSSHPYGVNIMSDIRTVDWGGYGDGKNFLGLYDMNMEADSRNPVIIGPYKLIKNLPNGHNYMKINKDGSKILIQSEDNIHIADISDENEIEFENLTADFNGWAKGAYFTNDGKIIYGKQGFYGDQPGYNYSYIHIMNDDGTNDINLTNFDNSTCADCIFYDHSISGDGSKLFFRYQVGNIYSIVINTDGTGQKIIDEVKCTDESCPDWDLLFSKVSSFDGSWGLNTINNPTVGNQLDIYHYDIMNKEKKNITNHPSDDVSPVIDELRGKIYFVSNRELMVGIYSMNYDGSIQTLITSISSASQSNIWPYSPQKIINNTILILGYDDHSSSYGVNLETGKLINGSSVYLPR